MSETKVKWVRNDNCWQHQGDDFWVSYKMDDSSTLIPFFAGDMPNETALIDCKEDKYYILNGDWREQYEPLIPKGFEACKAFFDKHPEAHSRWSN
jgi:hypothetical protein